MSLYKRKDSSNWWVKISHKGTCLQQSTGTSDRERAQEYHDTLKASLWARLISWTTYGHTIAHGRCRVTIRRNQYVTLQTQRLI